MTSYWQTLGTIIFWVTWPISWLHLHGSKRTRLLIVKGSHIIVTKRWIGDGKWSLPGGGLHKEESSFDCALRELYEETGIHLKTTQLRRQRDLIYHHIGLSFNYVLFVGKVHKYYDVQHRPIELTQARWIDKSELSSRNAQPDVLSALHSWWQ